VIPALTRARRMPRSNSANTATYSLCLRIPHRRRTARHHPQVGYHPSFVHCLPPPAYRSSLKLRSWWQLPKVGELAENLFPSGHGSHATASEIAITQSAFSDHIKRVVCTPQVAPAGPIRDAIDYHARFADGRIGSDPLQATPEKGGLLIASAADALIRELVDFTNERFVVP
jgi:hypothetical protein